MKTKTNRSSAKRLIILLSLALALLIAAGALSYAWIRNYIHVNNLDLQTGKMEYKVTLYQMKEGALTATTLFDTKNDPDNLAESVTTELNSIRKDLGTDGAVIDVIEGEEIFFIIEKYDTSIDFDVALSFDNDGIDKKYAPNYAHIGEMNYKMEDDSSALSSAKTEAALMTYLNNPGENSAEAENLGKIWNTVQKTEVTGDQKYACIRFEINDNFNAVSANLEGKSFPLRVGLCVAQHGALPDDELVDKFYVDDEITLKNALNNYGAGDEIYITQDVTYTGDMVFTRPCSLIVMHADLTINGNLIYTYMYGGRFVLNTVSDGHVKILLNKGVGGNFQIDLPNTSIELVGANNDNNADIYVTGSFTANASKAEGEGIFFKGARICEPNSTELKPLLIDGPARVSVSNRTRMGDITANAYCRNFILENGGYVKSLNLETMEWDSTLYSAPSILIDNSGTFGDTLIKLPKWSKKFIDSDTANRTAEDNTRIIANKGSGELRAITENNNFNESPESVASGGYFFSTGKMELDGYRDDIEYALREQFVETVGGSKDKIIIHYEAPMEMVLNDHPELSALTNLKSYVDFYFSKGEISAVNELKEVKIICYGDKALSENDYKYIRENMKTSLTTLDLSDAVSVDRAVPDNAFKGMAALTSIMMSESDTQWGKYIFTGTGVDEITFPQSLNKLNNSTMTGGTSVIRNDVLDGIKYVRTSFSVVDGLWQNVGAEQYFFTPDEYTRKAYWDCFTYGGADWRSKFFLDNGAKRYGEFFVRYDPTALDPTCEIVAYTGGYVKDASGNKTYVAWTDDAYSEYSFNFSRININGTVYNITSYDPYAMYNKFQCEDAYDLVLEPCVKRIGEYAFAAKNDASVVLGLVSVEIKGDPRIEGYSFAYNNVLESFRAENLTSLDGGYNLSNNNSLSIVYMPNLNTVSGGGDISTCPSLERVDMGVVERTEVNKTFYTSNDDYSYVKFYIHTENASAPSFYKAALAADYRFIFVKESYAGLYKKTETYTGVTEMGENGFDALLEADINGGSVEEGEEVAYYYILKNGNAHLVACLLDRIDATGEDYTTIETLGGYPVTYIGSAAYHFTYMIAQSITIPDGIETIGDYAFDSSKNAFKKYCITLDLNELVKAGKGAFYYMDMVKVIGNNLEEVGAKTLSYNKNLMVVDLPNLSRSRPAGSSVAISKVFEGCSNLRAAYIGLSDDISYDDAFSKYSNYIRFVNFVGGATTISIPSVNTVINSGIPSVSTSFRNNFVNSDTSFGNIYFSDYYTYEIDLNGLSDSIELPGYIYHDLGNGEVELFSVSPDVELFGNYVVNANAKRDYLTPGALYRDGDRYTSMDNGTTPAYRVTSFGKHAYGAASFSGVDNFIVADSVTKLDARALSGSAYRSSSRNVVVLSNVNSLDLTNVVEVGDEVCMGDMMKQLKANNLQKIGNYAFSDCGVLEKIYIPTVTEITGSHNFRNCDALVEATFGRIFGKLPENIFIDCDNLQTITFLKSDAMVTLNGNITSSSIGANVKVRVPAAVYSQYETQYKGSKFGQIPFANFEKFGEATEVSGTTYYWNVISDTEKTAYIDYFEGSIPATFTFPSELGGYKIVAVTADAMSALKNVTKVNLPANMEYLSFNTADISDTVRELAISTSNTKFKTVDGVLYTKDGATLLVFPKAKVASTFTLTADVKEIGYRAFYGTKNVQYLIINNPVTIRDNAFEATKISTIMCTSNTASVFAGRDIFLGANDSLKIQIPSTSLAAYKANVLVDYSIIDKFELT